MMTLEEFLALPDGIAVVDNDGDIGYTDDVYVTYYEYNDSTTRRAAWLTWGPYKKVEE